MEVLQFLLAPFVASLILAGIHTYLGLHVIERGVIFVDLALAQMAALGSAIALLYAIQPRSGEDYWISLLFTFLGAALFAFVKSREARIPQEAIIGISYAVASAASILALSKSGQEAEHLKAMLVGNLLFVSWPQVTKTGLLYGLIGLFHYVFRDAFLTISLDPTLTKVRGLPVWLWDLLFYASFGVVVTSSVAMAGVMLVFCYLIVPSVGGMLFARTIRGRLTIGWVMGTVVSVLGMLASVGFDLPTGATIVCTFGAVLSLMAIVRVLWLKQLKQREAEKVVKPVA